MIKRTITFTRAELVAFQIFNQGRQRWEAHSDFERLEHEVREAKNFIIDLAKQLQEAE